MRRHELSEAAAGARGGKLNLDHRTILHGILQRLRTGAPWRDRPERCGKRQTAYSRFRRWQRAGARQCVLDGLQAEANACGGVDWGLHFVDGTVVRPRQHAAEAEARDADAWLCAVASHVVRQAERVRRALTDASGGTCYYCRPGLYLHRRARPRSTVSLPYTPVPITGQTLGRRSPACCWAAASQPRQR